MITYNEFIVENYFNKKTVNQTITEIKQLSTQLTKTVVHKIIDQVYSLFIANKEKEHDRPSYYFKYRDATKDLFDSVMAYFKQTMFLGFINFDKAKERLTKII